MSKLKIVVTGASGFIGGHLVKSLSENSNIEVFALTRKSHPNRLNVFDYTQAPVGDVLIHLAENNNMDEVSKMGLEYENSSLNTIRSLITKKYSKIIYASSAVLYGDKSSIPHGTRDQVFVDSTYTRVKKGVEEVVLSNAHGIVLRLANVYGPKMSTSSVVSQILNQIPIPGDLVVRDIGPVRDFIWVSDVVEAIIKLSLGKVSEKPSSNIYNVGSGIGISIGELARLALDISKQPERRVVSKNHPNLKSRLILDYSKLTFACKWTPTTTLSHGLERLLSSNHRVVQ